jgi:hypothetical protein
MVCLAARSDQCCYAHGYAFTLYADGNSVFLSALIIFIHSVNTVSASSSSTTNSTIRITEHIMCQRSNPGSIKFLTHYVFLLLLSSGTDYRAMCQIIRERYGCCPEKVRREYVQTCAHPFQDYGPDVRVGHMCDDEKADRISLDGEICLECKARNRMEEKRGAIIEWLRGVNEHKRGYEGS